MDSDDEVCEVSLGADLYTRCPEKWENTFTIISGGLQRGFQIKKMLSQIFQEHCKEGVKKVGATLWWKKASHNCVLYPQVKLAFTICLDYFESRTKMWLCYIFFYLLRILLARSKMDPNRNEEEGAQGRPLAQWAYHEFHGKIAQGRQKESLMCTNKSW